MLTAVDEDLDPPSLSLSCDLYLRTCNAQSTLLPMYIHAADAILPAHSRIHISGAETNERVRVFGIRLRLPEGCKESLLSDVLQAHVPRQKGSH